MQRNQYDRDWNEAVLCLKQFLGGAMLCTIIILGGNCLLERRQQHLIASANDCMVFLSLAFQVLIIDREHIAERRRQDVVQLCGREL